MSLNFGTHYIELWNSLTQTDGKTDRRELSLIELLSQLKMCIRIYVKKYEYKVLKYLS